MPKPFIYTKKSIKSNPNDDNEPQDAMWQIMSKTSHRMTRHPTVSYHSWSKVKRVTSGDTSPFLANNISPHQLKS